MKTYTSASRLISRIRRETGFSQAELARRAGFARSVVNAYERGTRCPSVDALERIALAGGFELELVQRPEPVDPHRAGSLLDKVVSFAEMLPYEPQPFDYARLPEKGFKPRG